MVRYEDVLAVAGTDDNEACLLLSRLVSERFGDAVWIHWIDGRVVTRTSDGIDWRSVQMTTCREMTIYLMGIEHALMGRVKSQKE